MRLVHSVPPDLAVQCACREYGAQQGEERRVRHGQMEHKEEKLVKVDTEKYF